MGQAVWRTHENLTKTTRRRRPESAWVRLTVPPILDADTFHCNSHRHLVDRALRCPGVLRADVVEAQVWAAVVRILEEPELIAAEVARQEAQAEDQRAEIAQQTAAIDAALAKCDREAQRWADAYAAEVINLAELKGYRAEIEARRQGLLAEHAACRRQLEAIGMALQEVEALTAYCARVHQRLQAFMLRRWWPYRRSISG